MLFVLLILLSSSISFAKTKYAKETLNIRKAPNTESKIVGHYYFNDKVKILEKYNKKWSVVKYKGKKRYVASKYLRNKKAKYKAYASPTTCTFKSYEDAKCITNRTSIPQGKLKERYKLDSNSGVWTVDDRYCIAVGSYYTKKIGQKIDMVLKTKKKKHILRCITADQKADRDTVNQHRVHSDGSLMEFVVSTSSLPSIARRMGDVSYAGSQFAGKIVEIRVYK